MPTAPQPSPNDRFNALEDFARSVVPMVRDMERRVTELEAAELVREQGRTPRRRVRFKSQFGEDVGAWTLLGQPAYGTYIEVGAFDGVSLSVTYGFDAMGWDGVLIEAIPERYEQCRANRPDARVVHAALGPRGSTGTTTFVVTDDEHGGMLSYRKADGSHSPHGEVRGTRDVTVPYTTMDQVLGEATREFDIVSIDVEGGELALLQGFDLQKYRPRLVLIEDQTGREDVARHMASSGYTFITWLVVNRVFARSDLAAEIAARVPAH